MQTRPNLAQITNNLGRGFLTGQVFATMGAFSHALFTAPKGSKVIDFTTQFAQLSKQNGVSMAEWSLLHAAIDPHISRYIHNPYLNDIAGGAVSGAIMEWRNGFKGMVGGAFQGVLQNIIMNTIFTSVRTVSSPIFSYTQKRKMKKFTQARNAQTFMSPFNAITSAFFPQQNNHHK